MSLKRKKRYVRTLFHIVVLLSALLLWRAKWSGVSSYHSSSKSKTVATSTWQSPGKLAIDDILLMGYKNSECYISQFDAIFRDICGRYGNDWRLMSAVAHNESHFSPLVRSKTGAVGLMQIMPQTGDIYGVDETQLLDVETNIKVANLHYNMIDYMLDLPDSISRYNRQALILASYNGGIGRLFDAQRLARHFEDDQYSWSVVSKYLLNMREPEYYELDIVRTGRFGTARHTVSYVNRVLRNYKQYLEITSHCPIHLYPMALEH